MNNKIIYSLAFMLVLALGSATTTFIGSHVINNAPTEIESEYEINVIWDEFNLESDLPNLVGVSQLQASYFVADATIDGSYISEQDYILAFRYSEIVGFTTGWNSQNMHEVMVYGDQDLTFWSTYGLMRSGEIPTFKIYDVSTGQLRDAYMTTASFNQDTIKFGNLIVPFINLEA